MAAVAHGTDVVILLYGIRLAIERRHDDARGRNGVGHAAGLQLQLLISIIGADIHPVLVALVRELVLQFDMVEVGPVHVEAFYAHRHVISLAITILGTFSVHHPVVAWYADLHLAGRRDEVCRYLTFKHTGIVIRIHQTERDVLVVEVRSGIKLDLLGKDGMLAVGANHRIQRDVGALRGDG